MVWRRQPIVREGDLTLLDGVGHLGELIREALRGRDGVVPSDAAALTELGIRRIRGLPTALRRMLGLVVHSMLALFKSWMLVDLPHLEVVDFFHHRFPQSDSCIDKPIRYLQSVINHQKASGITIYSRYSETSRNKNITSL
jgi:hypothetical protein